MAHTCHAAGCTTPVPRESFMCRKHWLMIPVAMRSRLWKAYRVGQCDDWEISHAYADAARVAVRAVAAKENRPESEVVKACRVYDILDPAPCTSTEPEE